MSIITSQLHKQLVGAKVQLNMAIDLDHGLVHRGRGELTTQEIEQLRKQITASEAAIKGAKKRLGEIEKQTRLHGNVTGI